jgi:hypothetical protein
VHNSESLAQRWLLRSASWSHATRAVLDLWGRRSRVGGRTDLVRRVKDIDAAAGQLSDLVLRGVLVPVS